MNNVLHESGEISLFISQYLSQKEKDIAMSVFPQCLAALVCPIYYKFSENWI